MHRKAGRSVANRRINKASSANDEVPSDSDSVTTPDPEAIIIARRKPFFFGHVRSQKKRITSHGQPRDVASLQTMWYNHAASAAELYPSSMWRVLHAVRKEAKTTQSAVLSACQKMLPKRQHALWPTSRKAVDNRIRKSCGSFHARVMKQV